MSTRSGDGQEVESLIDGYRNGFRPHPTNDHTPTGHVVMAILDRVMEQPEWVVSVAERGSLDRLHIIADRSLRVAKTYNRDDHGPTIA